LHWAIQKVRRPGGERAGGYPGADRIAREFSEGVSRKRVGLMGQERAPVREGATLHDDHGALIGRVTSGTLGPTLNQPVAMAWLDAVHAAPGTVVHAEVRGKRLPMTVSAMPFAPHRYLR
jgi:aminomethyltransferase